MDNHNSSMTASLGDGSSNSPSPKKCSNGGGGSSGGRRRSGGSGRPVSLSSDSGGGGGDHAVVGSHIVRVVVNRDERGYGMKVSGDNPVYVQSVKEDGAAERAGLHAGDKILKVNGVNVTQSTHTQVVALIKSSSQVVLTVQQRSNILHNKNMGSPSLHNRPVTTPTSTRITGPQPVDNEKQYQLQLEKEQYYRLMIEKEQHYMDLLRSQIASSPDEKKCQELAKTERNLQKLQAMLVRNHPEPKSPLSPISTTTSPETQSLSSPTTSTSSSRLFASLPSPNNQQQQNYQLLHRQSLSSPNGNTTTSLTAAADMPPPLPKRNPPIRQRALTSSSTDNTTTTNNKRAFLPPPPYANGKLPLDINNFLNNEINANAAAAAATGSTSSTSNKKRQQPLNNTLSPQFPNNVHTNNIPPPLPPRTTINNLAAIIPLLDTNSDAVNSINKQMSYPLVATCATLVNDYSPNPTHHRTKSSPETLLAASAGAGLKSSAAAAAAATEAAHRKMSESLSDLTQQQDGAPPPSSAWEVPETPPPGTPPPPYPSPRVGRRDVIGGRGGGGTPGAADEADQSFDEPFMDSPDIVGFRGGQHRGGGVGGVLANSSPIHAATTPSSQQPIISMEDDEISDQEISQLEDHGHFKSLSRLWEHLPHLAVFTNYILSNSDPSSLLFYLITDLYKEGNAKEMRKWAFEIHSSFLVPGAPLRLSNVDENIAREIDEVLTKEYDKEEILRKIFWKARSRAKEELTRQLADFQQKRTAGLGTIFGPTDQALSEVYNDKAKEVKLYESLFLEKLEPYLDELDKENGFDTKRYYTAAALTTVLTRIFQIRPSNHHVIDRCPTFVNKEKYFRSKFIGRYSKRLNVLGHQFVAQPYLTVIFCTNCHQILSGISPQGYQCTACLINLHRHCVKQFEDCCPGPINKKDRGIMKLIGMRHDSNEHNRSRKSSQFLQMERDRRQMEERESSFEHSEFADGKQGQPVSRSGSDRRPDAVREENSSKNHQQHQQDSLTGAAAAAMAAATAAAPSGCISSGGGGGADLQHLDATSALLLSERKQDNTSELSSSTILPATGSSRRVNSNINRSESVKEQSEKRKQRRNISDPSHNTTSGNADLDHHHTALSNTDSGSSSNSSISCNGRLSESPSNSVDVVGLSAPLRSVLDSDSDMDAEVEPWQNLVPPEALRNLPAHEKKRQDVINEFFHTEGSHVRNLKVLYKIFYKKIQESQTLKPDELSLVFPNIKEMLDIHTEINKEMRRRRKEDPIVKELGTMLLEIFDDGRGEQLKKAAATFCERQQLALEFIKRRRERDSKFDAVLTECEKKRQCRRLQLQGILPTEMQRLSKYPLLLERLIHSVESNKDSREQQQNNNSTTNTTDQALLLRQDEEEVTRLTRAYHLSKEILNYVNDAAKVAHNRHRLEEIQKHLDTSSFEKSEQPIAQEFKTIDLTKYRLIIEGGMTLRRPNKALVPVHILLLEEAVVILHREGDRFLLKFFQSGSTAQPSPLSPIIKMNTLLVRTNAVCKDALFLVSTSTNNSQMYDLIAEDEIKREVWFKHFSDATEAYSRREGKPLPSSKKSVGGAGSGHHDQQHHQQQQSVDSDDEEDDDDEDDNNQDAVANDESANEVAIDLPPQAAVAERRAAEVDGTKKELSAAASSTTSSTSPAGGGGDRAEEDESRASPEMVTGGGAQSTRVTAEDWPLIQPSQVSVAVPPVYIADAMLTPLEQIRRKDALVKQALADKESLVADMLSIPREDFHHIADMASMDTSQHRDPSERVLACIFQGDQLLKAVNQSLNINDLDVMTNKGGKHPTCASQNNVDNDSTSSTSMSSSSSSVPLTVPSVVRDIATSLNSQLTTLLSEVKQIEEERDRLRKELHRVRERLHEEHNLHSPGGGVVVLDDSENLTSSTSCTSDQSTLNDSIQVVNKSDCEEEQ